MEGWAGPPALPLLPLHVRKVESPLESHEAAKPQGRPSAQSGSCLAGSLVTSGGGESPPRPQPPCALRAALSPSSLALQTHLTLVNLLKARLLEVTWANLQGEKSPVAF